jgi:hypothetical protein
LRSPAGISRVRIHPKLVGFKFKWHWVQRRRFVELWEYRQVWTLWPHQVQSSVSLQVPETPLQCLSRVLRWVPKAGVSVVMSLADISDYLIKANELQLYRVGPRLLNHIALCTPTTALGEGSSRTTRPMPRSDQTQRSLGDLFVCDPTHFDLLCFAFRSHCRLLVSLVWYSFNFQSVSLRI